MHSKSSLNPWLKVKISKVMGEPEPVDGFFVEGNGSIPKQGYIYCVLNVHKGHEKARVNEPYNWLCTKNVKRVIEMSWGLVFVAGDSLWRWEEVK